ncbi:MAG TPA: BlaI/MecI/CopY family transcriptional regulator [Phycisphaerae bacterium]|nr:BlaI/MecI/CopY family transcriptional regulator [Phycisphaerae bacterium]HOJ73078.1 BlaI/MecI/CopY family transcriptional regulator [Phycisphaerae bacterium]HOM52694.1 BlaI/MecI/CopY family transcriptional regulator [Phycisphaerae bacterium]HON66044.1 BlaI/MecI/CopY family transcriptional regulator [Phycisphaerae bacterium]HOQ85051.1 BlaI/MecI/CopY family transcriptional regulator [Phycisphaerae bacterium]
MKKTPRISDSEWQVLRVLWERSPLTAGEVVEALAHTRWKPKTIKTLLNRLVSKQAVGFEQEGRGYRYFPLVAEHDCVRAESRSFLQRVYGGALLPMLANFLEHEELSPEEIAELRRLLDSKGGKP